MESPSGLSDKGYELKGKLGSGGMGTVYQANQVAMKREVAIKILPEELADNPNYFVRFNREAETLTQLEHPHIVPVYDYGTVGRTSYIVMRMLTGGTLNQRLLTGKPMSLADTRQIIQQVTSALDYAHQKGIVHRDIKASNVMLDEQGNAYLTDFGIAKLLGSTTGFTATGMMLGTPAYMAPEQWKGSDSSAQTDIYALGVLLYAMLTGQMPFEAPTPYALMDKHLNASPKPPTDYQPTLPNGINRVIEKALAKDPQQRYSSAGALSDAFIAETVSATDRIASDVRTMALEEVPTTQVEQEQISEQPTTLVSQPAARPFYLRPIVAAPAILLVLATLIGGFLVFNSNGDNEDTTDNPDALVAADATDTGIPATTTATDTPAETEAAATTATDGSAATSAGQESASAAAQTQVSSTSAVTNPSPTTPPPTETPRTPTATITVAVTDTDTPTNTSTSTDTPTDTNTPTNTPTFTRTYTPSFTPSLTFTASPTASPTTSFGLPGGVPVTANNQWEPIERTINGVPMVLVPAGSYTMGASVAQQDAVRSLCPTNFGLNTCNNLIADEQQQSVVITFDEPFWIDKTEVTNAMYFGTGDNLPVTNVTWSLGQQHCVARGARLPTEAEWEYAARGPDGLYFPWGNTWDDQPRANICDVNCPSNYHNTRYDDGYAQTAPVGSFPDGASWVGALDMAGNVWEYTKTVYRNYPYSATDGREDLSNSTTARTLRGSSWNWIALETTTTSRAPHISGDPDTPYYGFRCARDYVDGDLDRFGN